MASEAFKKIQAVSPDDLVKSRCVVDMMALHQFPRQIMLLDKDEETIANYEYSVFPAVTGLHGGKESYTADILELIKEKLEEGHDLSEIYFLGSILEYGKLARHIKDIDVEIEAEEGIVCQHIQANMDVFRSQLSDDDDEFDDDDCLSGFVS